MSSILQTIIALVFLYHPIYKTISKSKILIAYPMFYIDMLPFVLI